MKIYVYEDVEGLTAQHHSDGGAVVVTDRDPLVALNEFRNNLDYSEHWLFTRPTKVDGAFVNVVEELSGIKPNAEFDASDYTGPEKVYVFPNMGCC